VEGIGTRVGSAHRGSCWEISPPKTVSFRLNTSVLIQTPRDYTGATPTRCIVPVVSGPPPQTQIMRNAKRTPKGKSARPSSTPRRTRVRGKGDFDESPPKASSLPAQLNRIEKKLDSSLAPKPAGSLGSGLGRLAGNFLGAGDLGAQAGDALQKWFGFGDYELRSNSLIKGAADKSTSIPTFSKDGKRGIRLTEREYIGDVKSSSTSGAFSNQSFRINPADPATFPWPSGVAAQFDEWEPLGVIFEYVPTSSEWNGSNQALGTVITATDYDPSDTVYANKLTMESADYACSTRPSNGLHHGIECDMSERPVRTFYTAISAPSTDLRLTDLGNFQIATLGVTGTSVTLGELWVTYDIALYKKQLVAGQVGATNLVFATISSNPTNSDPCGVASTSFQRCGSLNMTVTKISGATKYAFPPNIQTGQYEVELYAGATTSVAYTAGTLADDGSGNLSLSATFPGGNAATAGTTNNQPYISQRAAFKVNASPAAFVIADAALQYTGSSVTVQVRVMQIPPLPLSNI